MSKRTLKLHSSTNHFCSLGPQNGYPSRRRSLVDDARFETIVVKQTKQSVLEEAREKANGKCTRFIQTAACLLSSIYCTAFVSVLMLHVCRLLMRYFFAFLSVLCSVFRFCWLLWCVVCVTTLCVVDWLCDWCA